AGMVKRYSTWPVLTQSTVASHSWGVACTYVEVFGLPRAEVLYHCLMHDSGELWAGDLPFGVKHKTLGLKEAMDNAEENGRRLLSVKLPVLTEDELIRVKISDLLEMYSFGLMELNLGNDYAGPIVSDTLAAALTLAAEHNLSEQVNRWRERVL